MAYVGFVVIHGFGRYWGAVLEHIPVDEGGTP